MTLISGLDFLGPLDRNYSVDTLKILHCIGGRGRGGGHDLLLPQSDLVKVSGKVEMERY